MMDEEFRKSSFCEQGACAEVAYRHGMIGVRNTEIPGEIVWFTPDEWREFVAGVKADEFKV